MEDEVARVLEASISPDEATRVNAEQHLTQGGTMPGFGLALVRCALNRQVPPGTRQLAAVVLKKYVKEHWQEGEGKFFPPQTGDDEKAAIRELLPNGLADPEAKIRTACGMAIATIATWDWPQQWPQLTAQLVGAIRERTSEDSVAGALRCLAMILGDMEETQVEDTVPALLPELCAIVAADAATYTLAVKRRALAVLHACLLTLGVMSGARQRAVRDLMTPLLRPWLDVFAVALAAPPDPTDPGQCGLVLETLRCLSQVVQYFAKSAGDALVAPLGAAARLFHALAPAYHASTIGNESDEYEAPRDDEGEELSLESVVSQLLELIMCLVEHPKLRSLLRDGMEDTIYRAIGYMCMTAAQEEAWEDDPNAYVADEDDDMTTVRAACGMLLHQMSGAFGEEGGGADGGADGGAFSRALAGAVSRRLEEAEAAKVAGDPNWWKIREATLLAVGTVDDFIVDTEQALAERGVHATFSAPGFLKLVLDADLGGGDQTGQGGSTAGSRPPFLLGRALWVAARLAPGAPPAAATAVLDASLRSLDPRAPAPLRVGACRALAQYAPLAPKDGLKPFLGPAYQRLGTLLESEFNAGEARKTNAGAAAASGVGASPLDDGDWGETLHLVLEAILVVVKCDDEAAAAWSGALAPATLRVWAAKVADPLLAADARDVLEALAAVPACLPPLHQLAVPTLSGVLAAPDRQGPMLVESTLDLLGGLLKPAAKAEARAAHAACFRHVVALAVTSDDAGVLQSAAECLRAFLRSGGVESLAWGVDGTGGGGEVLRSYLDAAARLLSPSLEDGASAFAAPLLGQMLRRLPGEIAPILPEIVSAVVARVSRARQPNLIAALMSIFARLAHADCDALVGLLAQMPVPPGGEPETGEDGVAPSRNALELVLRAWCAYQPDVQGAFDIKLTTSALAALLASGNPALDAVGVRGELVIETGETGQRAIRTRAKARATGPDRYTTVPAALKILELLADAVLEAQEAALAGGGDGEDEWESEGDSDGDDDDGGGGSYFGGDLFDRIIAQGIDDAVDDDEDEAEDPISGIDTQGFIKERLGAMHARGALAGVAQGLNARRQRALMALMQ